MLEMKKQFMTTLHLFSALIVFFTVIKVYSSLFLPIMNPMVSAGMMMWLNNIIVPYGIAFPFFWLIIKSVPSYTNRSQYKQLTIIGFIKVFIIQSGLSVLVSTLIILLMMLFGLETSNLAMDYEIRYLAFNLFLLLLFNPLVEEIMFRKILLNRLLKWGECYAIIISSVFFAVPHLFSQGIPVLFFNLISGCIWAYVTVKTGQITAAVFLHSLSNFFSVFLPMIFIQSETADTAFVWLRVVILPVLAITLFVRDWKKEDFGYFKE